MTDLPVILLIDDHPSELRPLIRELAGHAEAIPTEPEEVEEDDLNRADLVLVDQTLEDWEERRSRPLSARPQNGLAVVEVLRSSLGKDRVVPFALYSNQLESLPGGWPSEQRVHVLARLSNLEWVFEKPHPERLSQTARQTVELARAAKGLGDFDPNDPHASAERLLGLGRDRPWYEPAWKSVRECYPPLNEVTTQRDSIVVLRWLLHRGLPYPTFLIDDIDLAAYLHIDPEHLIRQEIPEWLGRFNDGLYTGACANFLGRRWWRAAIQWNLWEATKGDLFDREALRALIPEEFRHWSLPEHVVAPVRTVDARLAPERGLTDISATVRLQPDDWPAYTALPRCRIELLQSQDGDSLRNLVVPEDLSSAE